MFFLEAAALSGDRGIETPENVKKLVSFTDKRR